VLIYAVLRLGVQLVLLADMTSAAGSAPEGQAVSNL
jgi:hypothetical protein